MKAQTLYDACKDGVISGNDMQEFFLDNFGEYSISGKANIDDPQHNNAIWLMSNSLQQQVANSPAMYDWACKMAKKYGVPQPVNNDEFWRSRQSMR